VAVVILQNAPHSSDRYSDSLQKKQAGTLRCAPYRPNVYTMLDLGNV